MNSPCPHAWKDVSAHIGECVEGFNGVGYRMKLYGFALSQGPDSPQLPYVRYCKPNQSATQESCKVSKWMALLYGAVSLNNILPQFVPDEVALLPLHPHARQLCMYAMR
jgi:hypothetical protein